MARRAASGRLDQRDVGDGLTSPVDQFERAADRGHAPPDGSHLGRQVPLRKAQEAGERGREHCSERDPLGHREVADEQRERPPVEAEPDIGVERAAEQLEVVGDDDERADSDERGQPRRVGDRAVDAEHDGTPDRDGAQPDERAVGDPRLQRVPFQLVERVRSDSDREEKRGERDQQPVDLEVRREGGSDHDVREMPQRVRRMQQRQVVAPAARLERIERRPARAHERRPQVT